MEFWASLIKVPEMTDWERKRCEESCTHVVGDYWIMEGDTDSLFMNPEDPWRPPARTPEVVAEGYVTSLGGLSQEMLIIGVDEWFGVDLSKEGE